MPPGHLLLQTVRSHDQFNTTIYGMDDVYRGITAGRRVVFIHPDDRAELGFDEGAIIDLISVWRGATGEVEERQAHAFRLVDYPTARLRRGVLSRDQRAGAAGFGGGRVGYADVQIDAVRLQLASDAPVGVR